MGNNADYINIHTLSYALKCMSSYIIYDREITTVEYREDIVSDIDAVLDSYVFLNQEEITLREVILMSIKDVIPATCDFKVIDDEKPFCIGLNLLSEQDTFIKVDDGFLCNVLNKYLKHECEI